MPTVAIDYLPREAFVPFHQRPNRFSSLVCHRRAGKTVGCINDLVAKAVHTGKKDARYAYIAPYYRQAKDVAWLYLKNATEGFAVKARESELRVELPNGAWITLYGADNPDALRGLYFDGVILDEFGDCRPSLWAEVVLPTLLDRKGWAVFIGTPKGKNHFWKINERSKAESNWFHMTLKASESGLISQEDLLEIRGQMTDDQYQQEMECSFDAAVAGTYYASLLSKMEAEHKMTTVPHDPEQLVYTASDIGFSDSTATWFWQMSEEGPRIIDYHEADGEEPEFYFNMFDEKPYEYDTMYLPHDAVAKTFATKRTTIEQFIDWADGRFNVVKIPKLAVQHGIDAARKVMPTCVFDQEKCFDGIEALRAYQRIYNELTKSFGRTPQHTWASNGADAFRYFALVTQEHLQPDPKEAIVQGPIVKPPEYTLDQLWRDREDGKRAGIIRI